MKNALLIFSLMLTFFSCKEGKEAKKTPRPESSNEIMGTWKMVYGEIRENDSVQIKDLGTSDFIKIINGTHFAFFSQDRNNADLFYGGGGTYQLKNNTYTEKLQFTGVDAIRDHDFSFTVEISKDSLIQYGWEEVKEAHIKRHIVEKYIRID